VGASGLGEGLLLDRRYRLTSKLGSGGFGAVWLGLDERTGRRVAVKVLHADVSRAEFAKVQKRFLDEAAILGQLDHPNIVRPLDRFVDGEHSCVVTEFVAGTTLRAAVLARAEAHGELRIEEVDGAITPILEAVAHAHARGVVHRDLKPHNVMLRDQGLRLDVKVLDFGIARLLSTEEADATTVGRLLGSVLYMAPEQFETPKIGPAADQFALASMIFELLTLRWAWAHDQTHQPMRIADALGGSEFNGYATLLTRISYGARPSVRAFRPDLPEEVDAVLHRAWQRVPGDRFASVAELGVQFRSALAPLLDDRTNLTESTSALTLLRTAPGRGGTPQILGPMPVSVAVVPERGPEADPTAVAPRSADAPSWLGPALGAAAAVVAAAVTFALSQPETDKATAALSVVPPAAEVTAVNATEPLGPSVAAAAPAQPPAAPAAASRDATVRAPRPVASPTPSRPDARSPIATAAKPDAVAELRRALEDGLAESDADAFRAMCEAAARGYRCDRLPTALRATKYEQAGEAAFAKLVAVVAECRAGR
jgi:serine/threonine protein kinase